MATPQGSAEVAGGARAELFEGALAQLAGIKGVRHAVMAVASRDGAWSWSGARGIADPGGAPMHTEAPFWIASVTKLFIAAAVLKLHEQGTVSIDDPVVNYLPAALLKGVHVVGGVDYADRLTIRHLLGHSSGISDYLEVKPKGEKTIIDRVLTDDDMAWSLEDTLAIIRKVNAPLFAPQDPTKAKYRIRYSDTNYQLLIAIVETARGKPIEDVYRELFFEPLKLMHTSMPGSEPLAPAPPAAAAWAQDTAFTGRPLAMRSFGDLNSTLDDLVEFMRALLDGRVFDKPETLELMRGSWQTFGFNPAGISPGWPIQYGLGMMRFQMPRLFSPLRPAPELIGHTGALGSWLFYCPELDVITAGTVDQLTAVAAPYRVLPKLLQSLSRIGGRA